MPLKQSKKAEQDVQLKCFGKIFSLSCPCNLYLDVTMIGRVKFDSICVFVCLFLGEGTTEQLHNTS